MTFKFITFALYFTLGTLFISCSSDNDTTNDNNPSNTIELPANLLGTYTGSLVTSTVDNDLGEATLVASSSGIYTINFSDNVPSVTGIIFTDIGNGTSFIFTDTDRGIVVSCGFTETETALGVTNSNPVISFGGEK